MKSPTVIVREAPRRDFLQREALENHFAARLNHLDGLRLNGRRFSAQEKFLHRNPAGFLNQCDLAHPATAWLAPGCGAVRVRGIDWDNGWVEKTGDSRDSVLNKHIPVSSNTSARKEVGMEVP